MNVVEIEEAIGELAGKPFDPKTFVYGFMECYGAPKAIISRIKKGDGNPSELDGGVIWRKWLHYKPSLSGHISDDLDILEASKETAQAKVRYAIACDGIEFGARDLKTGANLFCPRADLETHFGFFLPIAGIDRFEIADENPVDIKATGRMARLYDTLVSTNPEWATDARRHELNQFMTRVIFCLFAEDTGIFPDKLFSRIIHDRSINQPSTTSRVIESMFEVMNLSDKDGSRIDKPDWLCEFPYVNGALFAGSHRAPKFNQTALSYLLDAGKLGWKLINPDIFGSMIQSIVNSDERNELGMHYTSVPNILKVLNPLFLNILRHDVEANWSSKKGLQAVLRRMMKIRVFDPACGSGNFLVIAYREMREIEMKIIKRIQELTGEMSGIWSHIELKNFYGIELRDFAAETAKLALWIAEHQMNMRFQEIFGKVPPELPLRHGAEIKCGNALRLDWEKVCPSSADPEIETYVVGNPPYVGYNKQTSDQKHDLELVCSKFVSSWKSIDYVSGWIFKASIFIREKGSAALVATNSINQGENAYLIWEPIFKEGIQIFFAYRSFKWRNNAANQAGVTCSIVGFCNNAKNIKEKYIFEDNGLRKTVSNINQYLIESANIIIHPRTKPISKLPKMTLGNMAKDGGNLILEPHEKELLLAKSPEVSGFIRRFYGSQEFIQGIERYCIWVSDEDYEIARLVPELEQRFEKVRAMRLKSPASSTKQWAKFPYKFKQVQYVGEGSPIIIPRVSSESRYYLPVGCLPKHSIVSDLAYAVYDAPIWNVSLIASRLHLVWIATVCGKLESRYRYSNTLGWHTFPVPILTEHDKAELDQRAADILLAREEHFPATIAELYDPDKMPANLLGVHRANDETVEKIYIGRTFRNDTERLEHLFKLYSKMIPAKGKSH